MTEDWMLYSINTASPVGSCHTTVWISLAHACICQLIRAQLSYFTKGCYIYICVHDTGMQAWASDIRAVAWQEPRYIIIV